MLLLLKFPWNFCPNTKICLNLGVVSTQKYWNLSKILQKYWNHCNLLLKWVSRGWQPWFLTHWGPMPHTCQWTGSSMVLEIACYLFKFGTKQLTVSMKTYCQSDLSNKVQWNLNQHMNIFFQENAYQNCIAKYQLYCSGFNMHNTLRLRQNGCFLQATISNAFCWTKIFVFWLFH